MDTTRSGKLPDWVEVIGKAKFKLKGAYGDVFIIEDIDGKQDKTLMELSKDDNGKQNAAKYMSLYTGAIIKARVVNGEEKPFGTADFDTLKNATRLRIKSFVGSLINGDYFLGEN